MNQTAKLVCKALSEKKAQKIKVIEIKGMTDIADYFVICSGNSAPQVKAIYENLEQKLEEQDIFCRRKEGVAEGKWIAIDYTDVIVHIFHADTREFYQLDKLWSNGANVMDYND